MPSVVVSLISGAMLLACQSTAEQNTAQSAPEEGTVSGHKVVVAEVLQANAYTYAKVQEGEKEYWIAVTKRQMQQGETLFYSNSLEMKNFTSKDLDKTFETVHFVEQLGKHPSAPQSGESGEHSRNKMNVTEQKVKIDLAKDGISVAELFTNKQSYAGKIVKIRGKVTKFSSAIMGRNWVHIQDGTEDSGNYDLTITTEDKAQVGDVVTFVGKVALNRDFGHGYSYEVIIESAKVEDI